MSRFVLIPTATLIPPELQGDFGRIPSGMVPYKSRPAISWILAHYREADVRFVLAGHARLEVLQAYVDHAGADDVEVRDVGATRSLGETIWTGLQGVDLEGTDLVIHFGDTLVKGVSLRGDSFQVAHPPDHYRWTICRFDEGGRLREIVDKGVEKDDVWWDAVFVGVFSFSDGPRFRILLGEELERRGHDLSLDPFYRAVSRYYEQDEAPKAVEAEGWVDLGHLDTYFQARYDGAMGQRVFNSVSVDPRRGLLTKRSRNAQKFRDEVTWYLSLPPGLSYIAPRIFGSGLEEETPWATMEFYGYPPLSDIYLFSRLEAGEWSEILDALAIVLEDMGRERAPDISEAARGKAQREMYLDKTLERLRQVDAKALFGGCDGRPAMALEEALDLLPGLLEREGTLDPSPWNLIHGDFCLSNTLFDRRSRMVRLIDPRGRFGSHLVYGDGRYDLAKLSHSLNGAYDFLVNGLFRVSSEGGELRLEVFKSEIHEKVCSMFNEKFLSGVGSSLYRQVRTIEATLFLSMVPLHSDNPASQLGFLIRGLEIVRELHRSRANLSVHSEEACS